MNTVLTKVGLGVALAATSLTIAAPAEAQRYRHYDRYDRGSNAGTAIVAGIAGLAIGAAIASSNNRDRRYDDGRYYDNDHYYDRGSQYNYQRNYDNYYQQPRYNYRQQCRTQRVWDGYAGRYVRVHQCR